MAGSIDIVENFRKHFCDSKNIAIYGLGTNSEIIIKECPDINIVSLVANDHIGDIFFGMKVESITDAAKKVDSIVIVAQLTSIKIIYNRIKEVEQQGIQIYDFSGRLLTGSFEEKNTEKKNNEYWNSNSDQLKNEIEMHDSISFDIFDTLVMRKVTMPGHIFDLVEFRLDKKYREKTFFKQRRMMAEKELIIKGRNYNIYDIYNQMQTTYKISNELLEVYLQDEIQAERELLTPRMKIVDLLVYAHSIGKKVYIISDMYLPAAIMRDLLNSCGIDEEYYDDLMVSCDYGMTKAQGDLYRHYLSEEPTGTKLHIGDNKKSDIDKAQECGIDTFYVMSAYDMMLSSTAEDILTFEETLYDHILMGLWLNKAFNNPFALYQSDGMLKINTYNDLGYLMFAPLTLVFFCWMLEQLENKENRILLFSSRDGYLLNNLYQKYLKDEKKYPEGKYFYTSRQAATISSITSIDILEDELKDIFENSIGTLRDNVEARFGIKLNSDDSFMMQMMSDVIRNKDNQSIIEYIVNNYSKQILDNALEQRKHYIDYLEKIIENKEQVYLFDLETKGTVYSKLEKMTDIDTRLICFATYYMPNKQVPDMSKISSLLGNFERFDNNVFYRYEQFFEVVFSSEEGQFVGFDNNGEILFVDGTEYNYMLTKDIQCGIEELFDDFIGIVGKWEKTKISSRFECDIYRMILPQYSRSDDGIRNAFSFKDGFSADENSNIWDKLIGE